MQNTAKPALEASDKSSAIEIALSVLRIDWYKVAFGSKSKCSSKEMLEAEGHVGLGISQLGGSYERWLRWLEAKDTPARAEQWKVITEAKPRHDTLLILIAYLFGDIERAGPSDGAFLRKQLVVHGTNKLDELKDPTPDWIGLRHPLVPRIVDHSSRFRKLEGRHDKAAMVRIVGHAQDHHPGSKERQDGEAAQPNGQIEIAHTLLAVYIGIAASIEEAARKKLKTPGVVFKQLESSCRLIALTLKGGTYEDKPVTSKWRLTFLGTDWDPSSRKYRVPPTWDFLWRCEDDFATKLENCSSGSRENDNPRRPDGGHPRSRDWGTPSSADWGPPRSRDWGGQSALPSRPDGDSLKGPSGADAPSGCYAPAAQPSKMKKNLAPDRIESLTAVAVEEAQREEEVDWDEPVQEPVGLAASDCGYQAGEDPFRDEASIEAGESSQPPSNATYCERSEPPGREIVPPQVASTHMALVDSAGVFNGKLNLYLPLTTAVVKRVREELELMSQWMTLSEWAQQRVAVMLNTFSRIRGDNQLMLGALIGVVPNEWKGAAFRWKEEGYETVEIRFRQVHLWKDGLETIESCETLNMFPRTARLAIDLISEHRSQAAV